MIEIKLESSSYRGDSFFERKEAFGFFAGILGEVSGETFLLGDTSVDSFFGDDDFFFYFGCSFLGDLLVMSPDSPTFSPYYFETFLTVFNSFLDSTDF